MEESGKVNWSESAGGNDESAGGDDESAGGSGESAGGNDESDEGETETAGLYKDNGTFIPWSTLIEDGTLTVTEGEVKCNDTSIAGRLELDTNVTSIGMRAFDGCTSLSSINIPESVTSIGEHAFEGCTSLSSISIPESVISIGEYAFYGCTSLSSINIPSSVTTIGSRAFAYWTADQTINCEILEADKPSGWDERWDYYDYSTARKATLNWGVSM